MMFLWVFLRSLVCRFAEWNVRRVVRRDLRKRLQIIARRILAEIPQGPAAVAEQLVFESLLMQQVATAYMAPIRMHAAQANCGDRSCTLHTSPPQTPPATAPRTSSLN